MPGRYDPSRAPVVVWNLTRRCNQRCEHCYATASALRDPRELDTTACLGILDQMAEAGVPVVIFSGGEPMLRPDLLELVQHASNVGVRPQLSSNGTLATTALLQQLSAAGLGYLGVSIDGPAEFNDVFRGMPRGRERAVRGLEAAREAGVRTGLRMTVTAENFEHVPEMFALAEEVGASRFYVSHLVQSGRAREGVTALPPARTRELLLELFELALAQHKAGSKTAVVTGGNDSAAPLLLDWMRGHFGADATAPVEDLLRARGGNSAGTAMMCIGPDGEVHPDQFWNAAVLADLHDEPFSNALSHPLRAQLAERAKHLNGPCASCNFLDLCGGSHRERALALTGDPWASDPACVLLPSDFERAPLAASSPTPA